jgi:ABC-type antimicrobial peptide transport system permease subunit
VLALVLACIGLYGIMSYAVARRTNEIGIRMALGAERRGILRMVLGEALLLAAIGVVIGLPFTWAATRSIASTLYGLKATDPLTSLAATLLMAAVAVCAGYLPARRATKVDPIVALRYE